MSERIAQAAVRSKNGIVFTIDPPARHIDIIRHEVMPELDFEQGFLTEDGRFVDRKEARRIAEAAGQIVGGPATDSLYTENLW